MIHMPYGAHVQVRLGARVDVIVDSGRMGLSQRCERAAAGWAQAVHQMSAVEVGFSPLEEVFSSVYCSPVALRASEGAQWAVTGKAFLPRSELRACSRGVQAPATSRLDLPDQSF